MANGAARFGKGLITAAVMLAFALSVPFLAFADNARGEGALRVESSSGSGTVYRAVRIASEEALPLNNALVWADVAGKRVGDRQPFPEYDPASPNASEQGRALVQAVSNELTRDDDGTLATWLADFVRSDAASVEVIAGGPAVSVQNGWWLLTAPGRRPLLAWVDGKTVALGDKSDAPTLEKQVRDPETGEWGDSAIYGSGRLLEFRLVVSVPDSFAGYETYRCAFHDTWDERLSLVADSVRLALVSGTAETDITDVLDLAVSQNGFTATIDDLCKTPAAPGDRLVLTYKMTADPTDNPGSEGLVNDAWFTFPSWDGEGETPPDKTKSYAFRVRVRKASSDGEYLAGAVFALRNEDGLWLTADGSFGAEKDRLTFSTNEDGLTGEIPLIPAGSYVLVELEAPQGYELPDDPTFPFVISAEHSFDRLDLTVESSGAATVETVDAHKAEVVLKVINRTQTPPDEPPTNPPDEPPTTPPGEPPTTPPEEPPATPPGVPGTGDILPAFGGILLVAGLVILVVSRASKPGPGIEKANDHTVEQ